MTLIWTWIHLHIKTLLGYSKCLRPSLEHCCSLTLLINRMIPTWSATTKLMRLNWSSLLTLTSLISTSRWKWLSQLLRTWKTHRINRKRRLDCIATWKAFLWCKCRVLCPTRGNRNSQVLCFAQITQSLSAITQSLSLFSRRNSPWCSRVSKFGLKFPEKGIKASQLVRVSSTQQHH